MLFSFIKYLVLTGFFISIKHFGISQTNEDLLVKYTPELRIDYKTLDLRFRPIDYVSPVGSPRFDFMLGIPFRDGLFKVFTYTKFDIRKRVWTGIRIDNNYLLVKDRLNMHFQFRYFVGFNKSSADHYYFINSFRYKSSRFFNPGLLGIAKKKIGVGDKGFWFLGPMNTFQISSKSRIVIAFCYDVIQKYKYYLFLRFGLRIPLSASFI